MQNTAFSIKYTLNAKGRLLDLHTPLVMGVLNVTPDSFYDGGRFNKPDAAVARCGEMLKQGAAIIDIGGSSTRPGAEEISIDEECARVIPVIRQAVKLFPEATISIDTYRASVAEAAVGEGASMVNDISGGTLDTQMLKTVARLSVPYVLMHMRGTPATMTQHTEYTDLIKEMMDFFAQRLGDLEAHGIHDVIIDPGFGFAKTAAQGFQLLKELLRFRVLGRPILAGLSRKSMIWRTLGIAPGDALNGTITMNTVALMNGTSIIRVHDVREAVELVRLLRPLLPDAAVS